MARRRGLRRNRNKRNVKVVVMSAIALLFVMTVGYAAFSTNVSLNAKGNIIHIEKQSPTDLTAAENILPSSSTADGLYADSEETGRYVYKGANPSNYITIGDEDYRIMSIEADGSMKVIKNDKIDLVFDPGYSTAIAGVTEASSTIGTRYSSTDTDYCYASSESSYYGCKVWSKQIEGNSTVTEGVMLDGSGAPISQMPWVAGSTSLKTLPTTDSYINTYLNNTYLNSLREKLDTSVREKIAIHTYNVGPVKNASGQDLATDISQEQAYKWKGKVGLMTVTDYVKVSTNSACTSVREYYNTSGCYNDSTTHNYLAKSYAQWTMSPYSNSNSNFVWRVTSSGQLRGNFALYSLVVRPVLYLSSDIKLTGDGNSDNKFEIS